MRLAPLVAVLVTFASVQAQPHAGAVQGRSLSHTSGLTALKRGIFSSFFGTSSSASTEGSSDSTATEWLDGVEDLGDEESASDEEYGAEVEQVVHYYHHGPVPNVNTDHSPPPVYY